MRRYKLILIFTIVVILIGLVVIFSNSLNIGVKVSNPKALGISNIDKGNATTQYLEIKAKGGYSPSFIEAKANHNTILKVSTNNTFDCSASLSIPDIDYREMLPIAGEVNIELGVFKPGDEINGTCMMGMYGFKIKFI